MDNTTTFCLLILGVAFVIWIIVRMQQAQQREQARQAYLAALEELKAAPTNPDLKQKTLSLGRIYSNLTRNKNGVTLFDEVALMNDINAATAGATTVARAPQSVAVAATPTSVEDRLAKLSELKAKGLVDDAEYAAKRQKILDEM
ncbi:hypothetical protein TFLX_03964 [Thermoflexales bacterium]|nr:hypothetical protein TFLX_03964 [Thermoflexales bacterium]